MRERERERERERGEREKEREREQLFGHKGEKKWNHLTTINVTMDTILHKSSSWLAWLQQKVNIDHFAHCK